MKKIIIITIVSILTGFSLFGQVSNVKAEQKGSYVIITYDLQSSSKSDIQVFISTDGGNNYGNPLIYVSGDVGESIIQGSGKLIIWDIKREVGINFHDKLRFGILAVNNGNYMMAYSQKNSGAGVPKQKTFEEELEEALIKHIENKIKEQLDFDF